MQGERTAPTQYEREHGTEKIRRRVFGGRRRRPCAPDRRIIDEETRAVAVVECVRITVTKYRHVFIVEERGAGHRRRHRLHVHADVRFGEFGGERAVDRRVGLDGEAVDAVAEGHVRLPFALLPPSLSRSGPPSWVIVRTLP